MSVLSAICQLTDSISDVEQDTFGLTAQRFHALMQISVPFTEQLFAF